MSVYRLTTLNTAGVEIEVNTDHMPETVARLLKERFNAETIETKRDHSGYIYKLVGGSLGGWSVMPDGSVDGVEVVSPPLHHKEIKEQIFALCDYLNNNEDYHAGHQTGLHVHVGHRDHSEGINGNIRTPYGKYYGFDIVTIKNLIRLVQTRDAISRKAVKCGSWREGFCEPFEERFMRDLEKVNTFEDLRRIWYRYDYTEDRDENLGHYHVSRYHFLNLHCLIGGKDDRNGTVEFRLFNGTINADEINAYIDYCFGLVEMAERQNRISDNTNARTAAEEENPRYNFRTFCNKLGLVGDTYKITRKILRRYCEGISNRRK